VNVIWVVSDSLRRDHIGAYGNSWISTPSIDGFAGKSVRFDRHYVASFPTMPNRADCFTGRFTASFMAWEQLPDGQATLADILNKEGIHTAGVVDTPFYLRTGMNYDRGFKTFFEVGAQARFFRGEGDEDRLSWRFETDHDAPRTFTKAMEWLEHHYKEHFFLYIDIWDPHEPWDAPTYYTELYWPGYDGEIIDPFYNYWYNIPGFTEEKLRKAHATYCGEVTMVDTWFGHFMRKVENMGLMENTAIIFTTDHGFTFGEHGGIFGKVLIPHRSDGTPYLTLLDWYHDQPGWLYSRLGEEIIAIPLLIYIPGVKAKEYMGLTSAIDIMPTILDILEVKIPEGLDGRSLLPMVYDGTTKGREFVVSSSPFWNAGDTVPFTAWSHDGVQHMGTDCTTKITTDGWTLLFDLEPGKSQLYDLSKDPQELSNVIDKHSGVAKGLHKLLIDYMRETKVLPRILKPRMELKL